MANKEIVLSINNLSKAFTGLAGIKENLFEGISLNLCKGQFKSILGPGRIGKSTLLRIIAGLEEFDSGKVDISKIESYLHKVAYIPSNPSSLPWLNVEENIQYILNLVSKSIDKKKIKEFINLTGLNGYEKHYPNNKSIGYRFRISLARALAVKPQVILLDEPFNTLVPETKNEIYLLLMNIHNNSDISFFLTTSNISEAIIMSDSVILLGGDPIKILKEIEISLPKDRGVEIINEDQFEKIRNEIIQIYNKESNNSLHFLTI